MGSVWKMSAAAVLFLLAAAASMAAPLAQNEAYVLLHNLPLWQEQAGGVLKWMDYLTIGDKVTVLNRTAKFKQDGAQKEFTRVRAPNGKEGWVRPAYLAQKAGLGVVRAEGAVIYAEPRDVKVTAAAIPYLTVVAIMLDGAVDGFVRVAAYDSSKRAPYGEATFVVLQDLTTADADINAAILYTAAMGTRDAGVKKSLLTVAANKYSGSIFASQVQATLGAGAAAPRATVAASGRYVVNSDNVNVRAAPDEKSSQVVEQLDQGQEVTVVEATSQAYTVAGQTAPWYRISDPDGWVFGSFLSPAP